MNSSESVPTIARRDFFRACATGGACLALLFHNLAEFSFGVIKYEATILQPSFLLLPSV